MDRLPLNCPKGLFSQPLLCESPRCCSSFGRCMRQARHAASSFRTKAPEFSFTVSSVDFPRRYHKKVKVREECFSGGLDDLPWWTRKKCEEFDYGYVLTCHKAQGSQWDNVLVYDESGVFRDDAAG